MATYPCTDDPSEIIEAVVGAGENAEKFDKFVNGGVTEEVQLGAGQPTPTLRNLSHLVKSAAATLDGTDVSGKFSDAANGGTELRMLSERFGDLVNVKDFGAVGDGVEDDSEAWSAWQTALASGGIGYIPSGDYLVDGEVWHFPHGCFGNAAAFAWDSYVQTDSPFPESGWTHDPASDSPLLKNYAQYSSYLKWGPQIELSFDATSDHDDDKSVNGPGPIGLEVKGAVSGSGDYMPTGVRASIENKLATASGDAVALWGRVHKVDPDGGVNNSASCGMHCAVIDKTSGTGVSMASEFWGVCCKTQGDPGTVYASWMSNGGVVCQQVKALGASAMLSSAIAISAGNSAETYPYGAWSAISIHNNLCRFNGNTAHPANTCFIKSPNLNPENGPESFIHAGWCPKHIRITGAYDFNVFANHSKFHATGTDSDCFIVVEDQYKSDSVGTENPRCGIMLASKSFGGEAHAPNYGATETVFFDLYHERNSNNIFYRNRGAGGQHIFWAVPAGEESTQAAFCISATSCFPGQDGAQSCGNAGFKWSQVYASTGTINTSDERVKDNIEAPSDALMRAWGKVNFKVFQFRDAIEAKGADVARLHVGVIAQQVVDAFAEEGLDATRYGLLCHDSWEASPRIVKRHWVVDEFEKRDDEGNLIEEEKGHYEDFVENPGRPAGDLFSIRYDEALALECAYQRWLGEQRDARIAELEAKLNKISGDGPAPSGASPDNL